MVIVGLTGGIGSGKSAAARRFAEHGLTVIDADRVGHGLIAPGGRAEAEVRAAFGADILTCGTIDRGKLGKRVFSDPEARARLNAIVHPLLFREISAQCAAHGETGAPACIVDAALLGESGQLDPWLDCLILVVCPEAIRVQRLVDHRGMDPVQARQRMAAQTDPERKRELARWVIDNSGSPAELAERVDAVALSLLSYARSR